MGQGQYSDADIASPAQMGQYSDSDVDTTPVPGVADKVKGALSSIWDSLPTTQVGQVAQHIADWANQKAANNRQENLVAASKGLPLPHDESTNTGLSDLGSLGNAVHGVTTPKGAAIAAGTAGALALAPEITGPALIAHGMYNAASNAPGALAGNPDAVGGALGGAAEALGGATIAGMPAGPLSSIAGRVVNNVTGVTEAQNARQAIIDAQTARLQPLDDAEHQSWVDANKAINAPASSRVVRMGQALRTGNLADASTIPGRGLVRAGLDPQSLSQMTPIQQSAAIAPKLADAGRQIDLALSDANARGVTLDVRNSALKIFNNISDPDVRNAAIDEFDKTAQNAGVGDTSAATPGQAWKLRKDLQNNANFNSPTGSLGSVKNIGKKIYGAVTGDMHNAMPELIPRDQQYSDLKTASDVVGGNNNVVRQMVGKPVPASPIPPPVNAAAVRSKFLKNSLKIGGAGAAGTGLVEGARYLYEKMNSH